MLEDYYTLYKLDRAEACAVLYKQLREQGRELRYLDREAHGTVEARVLLARKLELLDDALKRFESQAARDAYDLQLERQNRPSQPPTPRPAPRPPQPPAPRPPQRPVTRMPQPPVNTTYYPPPPPVPWSTSEKNGIGTAALVCGIAQFFCLGPLGSILAIVFGRSSMAAAKNGKATNGTFGRTGFILGIVGLVLMIVVYGVYLLVSLGDKTVNIGSADTQTSGESPLYFEAVSSTGYDRYTGNEGDSNIVPIAPTAAGCLGTTCIVGINGVTYEHGLDIWVARYNDGPGEESWVWRDYQVPKGYSTLLGTATVSSDCTNSTDYDTTVNIVGDGRTIFSQRMTPDVSVPINVNVSGVTTIRISATDNSPKNGGTCFLLGDLRLLTAATSVSMEPSASSADASP